jgi:hypothetical protein
LQDFAAFEIRPYGAVRNQHNAFSQRRGGKLFECQGVAQLRFLFEQIENLGLIEGAAGSAELAKLVVEERFDLRPISPYRRIEKPFFERSQDLHGFVLPLGAGHQR